MNDNYSKHITGCNDTGNTKLIKISEHGRNAPSLP